MIKNNKKNNVIKESQKGFALVEVIAALGISALVITALISLSISTLRTSLDSELLLEGTKVANREIELVRAYRDGTKSDGEARSWLEFIDDVEDCFPPNPCSVNVSDGAILDVPTVDTSGGVAKQITRSFVATTTSGGTLVGVTPTPSVVRISVSVAWKVGDKDKGSYIYTDLSNWRGR